MHTEILAHNIMQHEHCKQYLHGMLQHMRWESEIVACSMIIANSVL